MPSPICYRNILFATFTVSTNGGGGVWHIFFVTKSVDNWKPMTPVTKVEPRAVLA